MEERIERSSLAIVENGGKPKPNLGVEYCQQPSDQYMALIDDCLGDPKSALGARALQEAGSRAERGWQPTWDARERIEP